MRLAPWRKDWPDNIWLRTTVEDQEPLLGQLDLSTLVQSNAVVNWIIAGGESGPGARPMAPVWVRSLRDFAKKRKIAFHFKQ